MNKKKKRVFIFLFFLLSFTLFCMIFLNKGLDYFWHLKAGEVMWKNKIILKKDVFSFLSQGKQFSWISHEWAQEVLLFGIFKLFPKWHIFIYCFSLLGLLYLFLFLTHKNDWLKNIPFSIFMMTLSLVSFGNIAMPRPMMISNLFLAMTLFACFDFYKKETGYFIFFLPVLSLLWANFHGGSSNLSYLFPLFFGIVSMISFNTLKIECKRKKKKTILCFFLVAFLSFLTIAINPHGIKMWFYPYQNMGNTYMLKTIREWAPTVPWNLSHLPFFFLLGFILFILFKRKQKIKVIDLLVLLLFTYLGLKSVRFWGYLYLASTFILFDYIEEIPSHSKTNVLLITFSFFLLILFGISIPNIQKQLTTTPLSHKMIEEVKTFNPARLYNFYDYGGYLIEQEIPVFIDGRADFYSEIGSYQDYFKVTNLEQGFQKVLKSYSFDSFLVSKKTPLYQYLTKEKYPLIYQEKEVAFFQANH